MWIGGKMDLSNQYVWEDGTEVNPSIATTFDDRDPPFILMIGDKWVTNPGDLEIYFVCQITKGTYILCHVRVVISHTQRRASRSVMSIQSMEVMLALQSEMHYYTYKAGC